MAGHYVVLCVVLCTCFCIAFCAISCLDNNGNAVDWFIVYKLPKLKSSKNALVRDGVGQMYLDVTDQKWKLLDKAITDTGGHAIYNTLQQVYTNYQVQDVAYLLYNDETPSGKQQLHYGHTKGDVCFDKISGFWLIHSVPKFPPVPSEHYSYPESGTVFGQTLLCITFSYQQFDVIGQQLMYTYPQLYGEPQLPADMAADNKNIAAVIKKLHVKSPPWFHSQTLTSLNNQQFISFAKFTKFGRDLYDSWVAPTLQSELKVQTWRNGGAAVNLPSNCSTRYHVLNVETLNIEGEQFKFSEDHSKWAVASTADWICIGGINRQSTQFRRAGGTVCAKLPLVSKLFRSCITSVEDCNKSFIFSVANRLPRVQLL